MSVLGLQLHAACGTDVQRRVADSPSLHQLLPGGRRECGFPHLRGLPLRESRRSPWPTFPTARRRCHDGARVSVPRPGRRCGPGTTSWRGTARCLPSARTRRGGMAALVLEGEAGIGKSTLWLAGVEAARERGLRVLSARPAEVELGSRATPGWETCSRTRSATSCPSWPSRGDARSRPPLLLGEEPDEPVDFRTLAVAVRNALQLLAERRPILVAVDDVQWLDASSTNRPGVRAEALAGDEHSPAPGTPGRRRHPGVGARACRRRAT